MSEFVLAGSAEKEKRIGVADRVARRLVLKKLDGIGVGDVRIVDGEGERRFGRVGTGPTARVTVHDPGFYRAAAFGGSVGAAEAYMDGMWDCDDLVGLLRVMLLNGELAKDGTVDQGWGRLTAPAYRLVHALHRNTFRGSRRNIAAHYDLGNAFFRLFLDENLMYSCAIFPREDASLEEASRYKVDRICRKLALTPEDHVLEIGTGWGGFAIHAAKEYGCRVTTATISQAQYELAKERVAQAGLADWVEVVLRDYRELEGKYDKLVSIEMIEAVGYAYYDTFFRQCSRLLKPEGLMMLQAITMSDWAYEGAKRSVDFIKRYVFPGSCIPSVTAIASSTARETDLRTVHLEDIGSHYVPTLKAWRERFLTNVNKVRAMGYGDRFVRMWTYYLCYCEAGFRERYISDVQMLMAKPLNRRGAIVAG
ncbi:MAG: cyclopropane-fatty-acyl-phospholipid synthase, partial [bacterium]|nr:cyclopropane-fatty-acyl-phospholipid synthase [bacterium]